MSRPTIVAQDDFQATTADILEKSRANNVRHGLSGVLVGNENWFVQVLEGPYQPLHEVLNRILVDTRHHDVHLFEVAVVPSRLFGTWSMLYSPLDHLDPASVWACVDHFKRRSPAGAEAAIRLLTDAARKAAA
jgi:hypothetical protein